MPCKRELRGLRTFAEVVSAVETVKGEGWRDFSSKHGDWGRDMILALAREFTGMTLREIGVLSGGMDYSAVSEAIKRLKRKKEQDYMLATAFSRASQILNIET